MSSLGIFGANGKMGKAIYHIASQMSELSIMPFKRGDDITIFIEKSDFIIDFSNNEGTIFLTKALQQHKPKPLLIGTTALSAGCLKQIDDLSNICPIMVAPNCSISANLQALIVEKMANTLTEYDIEIIDIHHKHKKDAPSGTALMLAKSINKGLCDAGLSEYNIITARSQNPLRSKEEISISSLRAGNVVGEHIVSFYGEFDSFSITHKAYNRELFAHGAIKSILWLKDKKAGKYSIRDMLVF